MTSSRVLLAAALAGVGLLLAACSDSEVQDEDYVIYDSLFSVSVPDPENAVAVGYYGSIRQTRDGGKTWLKRESGTNKPLYSVSMADPQHGWAVGQTGLILRTADGGETWARQPNLKEKEGSHLFSVHAIDANTAWAVGEWGTRLYTDDGGRTWQDRSITIDEAHPRFVWLSPDEQDRVRAGEAVYEDVGLNYVYCNPRPSRMCWISGEFGYIYWSDDLGRNWHRGEIKGDVEPQPILMGFDEIEVPEAAVEGIPGFVEQILEESHLNVELEPTATDAEIAKLYDPEEPERLFDLLDARLNNVKAEFQAAGLLSDRIRLRSQPPYDWMDFIEDDPEFLERYVEGRRTDGEKGGVDVRIAQNPYLFTIRFTDDENGLISGLGGVILQSADGGRTWSYEETGRKQALFSVDRSETRIFAVGEKGLVRESLDGGKTWAPPKDGFPDIFTFMRDLRFAPDDRTGFIVGQRGMVLRTADGGESWQQVMPPDEARHGAEES